MYELIIHKWCPSVQGHNIGKRLKDWRFFIHEELEKDKFLYKNYDSSEDAIRDFILSKLNGPSFLKLEFYLRATNLVTDLDNMSAFFITCFKTEVSPEADEIERVWRTKPWFYYTAFNFPGNFDILMLQSLRKDGSKDDLTIIKIGLINSRNLNNIDTYYK